MTTATQINQELRHAAEARARELARLAGLRAIALDRSLGMETRLRAFMAIDATMWARRQLAAERLVDLDPDRIELAKRRSEERRLARKRAARISAGLPTRPRKHLKTAKVNDEFGVSGPQNRAAMGSLDEPATSVPLADRLTTDAPNDSRSRARDERAGENRESELSR